ncbi:hypothetical protein [Macrococcoides canis]|uniref:hypothetical protein n=1 Tax=Macrococcoides canis TaxID=1855823 RepID=UPI001F22F076|nr:hypothetical protein [Macrococcus canis]
MKHKSLLFILVMASLAAFGPLSIDMYLPALPEVKDKLHSTTAEVQLTLSFFMFGLALGNISFGTLSDTTGRKTINIQSDRLYYRIIIQRSC